ncbi:MAG: acyltransferase family protein, partial [Ilumatobacteraceae bacterium]
MAFHTGLIEGGWIGVDVFFAISGFLITGLLVAEHERSGTISLGAFWGRRFRRLVPALFVLLGLIVTLVHFDQVNVAGRNVWGALTYSTNWVHIFGGASYWDQFATPDPLRHLWSLAIEEQFYLVWPVVAWFVLRRHDARALIRVAIAAAVVSAVVQIIGIHGGLSVDRVYQGTDTRAVAFLIGAALASRGWPPVRPRALSRVAATACAIPLLGAAIWLPGDRDWVFSGSLIVVSVLGSVVVLLSATNTSGWLHSSPLRAIGRWSYGIYLFHWPLAVSDRLLRLPNVGRFVVVTLISIALAALSHRFVESPVRHRRVHRALRAPALALALAITLATFSVTASAEPAIVTDVTLAPRPVTTEPIGSLPPRVMVFGDSLPAVAADELRDEAHARGLEIDVHADPGCVPSEDERDQYGKPECITFLRGVRQRAIDLDIDTVVIWWGGTGIGFVEQGVAHDFCAPESAPITRDRIRRLISYFDGVVGAVVLVAPVPRTDIGAADAAGTGSAKLRGLVTM